MYFAFKILYIIIKLQIKKLNKIFIIKYRKDFKWKQLKLLILAKNIN